MIILAIDTTSEFGSLALRVDGETRTEVSLHSREGFGHLLFPAIDQVLQEGRLKLPDVDCFAGASGPGAFTGVRLDLAAVKGLAEAMGKPAVDISNLRALSTFGSLAHRAVVLDARRGEIFGAVYDAELQAVSPEIVMRFSAWLEGLELDEYEFISHDWSSMRHALAGTRFERMRLFEAPRRLAAAIAHCAESDPWTDPAIVDANYVRRCDAEFSWKDA